MDVKLISSDKKDAAELQQAVTLATGDLMNTAENSYLQKLSAELKKIQPRADLAYELMDKKHRTFTEMEGFRRILFKPLARGVMFIIWRESEFVSESALSAAGCRRQFGGSNRHLTRNSLKNFISDQSTHTNANEADALKAMIDRICDALEVHRLVERMEVHATLKPMCGTHRLNNLMSRVYAPVTDLLDRQLLADDGVHDD